MWAELLFLLLNSTLYFTQTSCCDLKVPAIFRRKFATRVRSYLKEHGKSGLADHRYYLKAGLNMALYLVPFSYSYWEHFFLMTTLPGNHWSRYGRRWNECNA